MRQKYKLLLIFLLTTLLLIGCGSGSKDKEAKPIPRPVSYMLLKKSDPIHLTRVTGSVESWKVEKVGFEVAGRILFVVERGVEISGNIYDENGEVLTNGTVVAELQDERHMLRLKEANARVAARQADLVRREREYKRQASLVAKGATSKKKFEQAESEFGVARARLREAERLARQTEVDLRDTRLYSPFHGQVSKVHVIPGAYVERGQPVVSVQMMDPVKVEIAVSPRMDRQINYGDMLKVYIDGYETPLEGAVWYKGSVADAATRTFMVTLLVRNRLIEVGVPDNLRGKPFHRTNDIMKVEMDDIDGQTIYWAEQSSIHRDDEGHFLWKVEGLSAADLFTDFNPEFTVSKARIKLGKQVIRFLQSYTFRELEDLGGLNPESDLVTGALSDTAKEGDTVFFSRKQWLMRPGELVHVDTTGGKVTGGFYVPAQAIIEDDGGQYVFVVKEAGADEERTQKVEVIASASLDNFRRIEASQGQNLKEGMKLIVSGAHYLGDGDLINAFDEVEVSP